MNGMELVYHSAGLTYMGDKRNPMLQAINVDGARNVLEAALEAGVRRVVHVSSITAVGICDGKSRSMNHRHGILTVSTSNMPEQSISPSLQWPQH